MSPFYCSVYYAILHIRYILNPNPKISQIFQYFLKIIFVWKKIILWSLEMNWYCSFVSTNSRSKIVECFTLQNRWFWGHRGANIIKACFLDSSGYVVSSNYVYFWFSSEKKSSNFFPYTLEKKWKILKDFLAGSFKYDWKYRSRIENDVHVPILSKKT